MVTVERLVRPAVPADQQSIANLIYFELYIHRHLDWRTPLDWLGSPHFWVAEENRRIVSALACPSDPEGVAWIRLFVASEALSLRETWLGMWDIARRELTGSGWKVAAIALQDWFQKLLESSGFVHQQDIVMLDWVGSTAPDPVAVPGLTLRPISAQDLAQVAELDAAAFNFLWRNSLETLHRALPQAGSATVAELDGKMAGYQISTQNPFGAHLARLAVQPEMQHRGVAHVLVTNLIGEMLNRGLRRITVNTQNDNQASLALYLKLGFKRTQEEYPVYVFNL